MRARLAGRLLAPLLACAACAPARADGPVLAPPVPPAASPVPWAVPAGPDPGCLAPDLLQGAAPGLKGTFAVGTTAPAWYALRCPGTPVEAYLPLTYAVRCVRGRLCAQPRAIEPRSACVAKPGAVAEGKGVCAHRERSCRELPPCG